MRDIKFRAWDKKRMVYFDTLEIGFKKVGKNDTVPQVYFKNDTFEGEVRLGHHEVMQFTGLKDKNGKDIYEGDIFRVEENDLIYYLVIVWVQEWCMFCTLRVDDEYPAYLQEGIKALDEPMFWTYTLEDTDSQKFFLCGNIHQHPHLLP